MIGFGCVLPECGDTVAKIGEGERNYDTLPCTRAHKEEMPACSGAEAVPVRVKIIGISTNVLQEGHIKEREDIQDGMTLKRRSCLPREYVEQPTA